MSTKTVSLHAYHPLFGDRVIGRFPLDGMFSQDYFTRYPDSLKFLLERITFFFLASFVVKSVSIDFVSLGIEFDGAFQFGVLVHDKSNYFTRFDVAVYAPSIVNKATSKIKE